MVAYTAVAFPRISKADPKCSKWLASEIVNSIDYSGLFDAVKINEAELAQLYQYDSAMLDMADEVGRAIDNVEASIGWDGLPAAIRHLVSLARQADQV
jgi:hypothetical protein